MIYAVTTRFGSETVRICAGRPYNPSTEMCVNGLVREIKKGFDTLYVSANEYSWMKSSKYYYTDGESAYVDEIDSYDVPAGCTSNSSTAYTEGRYSSFESVSQMKEAHCGADDFSDCKIRESLYFFSVKDGTHEVESFCSIPIDGGYRVVKKWQAKFNSEFTYLDFVKAYAPRSCGGTPYYIQKNICYNGELIDLCDDNVYDPEKQFCYKGEGFEFVAPFCNGAKYDAANLFCYEGSTYKFEDYYYDDDAEEYNTKYPRADYIRVSYNQYGWDGGLYPRSKYGECKENLLYVLGEEECVAGEVVKIETTPTCGSEIYDPAKEFCAADEVYDLCGEKSYDPNAQFCFDGKAYDNATYDVCKNSDDEETAVYNKSTQFCFNGEAYASDSYAQCNNEIVEKLETGGCVSNGSDSIYVEMPEELYIVNDFVKMKTYSVSGLVRTWTGLGLVSSAALSSFTGALEKSGYEKSDVAGTYVMTVGMSEYSITLEVSTMKNGRTTVKVTATQAPKKIIKG